MRDVKLPLLFFSIYFVWNEPDADEGLHICQLYCSISISMPTNDDHSFLSQMLRFAIYFTTCNCNESCKNLIYVSTLKVVQTLNICFIRWGWEILLTKWWSKENIQVRNCDSYETVTLYIIFETYKNWYSFCKLNITLVAVVVSFYGFVNTKDNLSDPETI